MGEMLYDVPLYREVADLDIGIGRTKVRYRGLAKNTAQLAELELSPLNGQFFMRSRQPRPVKEGYSLS